MANNDEYKTGIDSYFSGTYDVIKAEKVPGVSDVKFGNYGKKIELAMMFVDIEESTEIVDGFRSVTAARMYKSFLWAVTRIVKEHGGDVKSFNGDGLLVVFSGDKKNTNAAKAAFKINWFVKKILKPKIESYFRRNDKLASMNFNYGLGIDTGQVLVVRAGIKGEDNSDLVWVGNSTNFAVQLSSHSSSKYPIYITNDVFNKLNESAKTYLHSNTKIWEKTYWSKMNDKIIYRTNYWRG